MTKRFAFIIACTLAASLLHAQTTMPALPAEPAKLEAGKWTPLFNGRDLSGFYAFVAGSGRSDPESYFKVENGMIHVMDVPVTEEKKPFGYFATDKSYENFHIRFQYKWGQKQFVPRAKAKRDAGILYYQSGDDHVWPNSFECQVQEGDTGDLWLVGGKVSATSTVKSLDDKEKTFAPDGTAFTLTKGRIIKDPTADSLTEWNTVEVMAKGDSAVHIVNGKIVMRAEGLQVTESKQPVTSGRISFQAEGAELFYRNIEIRPLGADEKLPTTLPSGAKQP